MDGVGKSVTPQQARCLELVDQGLTTPEIAHALNLAPSTVNEHIEKAMQRLGAPTRKRAAAMIRSMIDPTDTPEPVRGEIHPVDDLAPVPQSSPSPAEHVTAVAGSNDQGEIEQAGQTLWVLTRITMIVLTILVALAALPTLVGNASKLADLFDPPQTQN